MGVELDAAVPFADRQVRETVRACAGAAARSDDPPVRVGPERCLSGSSITMTTVTAGQSRIVQR
jgi:hypothetical protein